MDITHAEVVYRHAVEINRQSASHRYLLGAVYYRMRRFADAVNQLLEAQRLSPNDAAIRAALLLAEWAQGMD